MAFVISQGQEFAWGVALVVIYLMFKAHLSLRTEDSERIAALEKTQTVFTANSSSAVLLTVSGCAEVLGLNPTDITSLLERGELGGLKIKGEWRILPQYVVEFLIERAKQTQLEVLANQLKNPDVWAEEIRKHPNFRAQIETGNYSENTLGKFLQDALASRAKPIGWGAEEADKWMLENSRKSHDIPEATPLRKFQRWIDFRIMELDSVRPKEGEEVGEGPFNRAKKWQEDTLLGIEKAFGHESDHALTFNGGVNKFAFGIRELSEFIMFSSNPESVADFNKRWITPYTHYMEFLRDKTVASQFHSAFNPNDL